MSKPITAKRKVVNEWVPQATYAMIKGFSKQYVTQLRNEKKVDEREHHGKIQVRDKQA